MDPPNFDHSFCGFCYENAKVGQHSGFFLSILQQKELLFLLLLLDKTKKERLLLQPLLVVIPLGIIPQQR